MGSETPTTAARKAIEADLEDIGVKILARPSSVDELLLHLETAEGILAQVSQLPPQSTCRSLYYIMKALIMDEVLHHNDLNIQVAVASCFSELSRITAPDIPYPDDHMKVFFKLCMIAFEQLPIETSPNYSKVLKIVETMSEVKSSLIMLDIECDEMIVEMFQLFLNNIRSCHPAKTFENMEKILSVIIEESDDISVELLKLLLASVKMDNKNTSSISWELGKRVFENNAAKVQPYLKDAANEMNLDLHDYAEIVACICRGENMVFDMLVPKRISGYKARRGKVPREVTPTVNGGPSRLEELSRDFQGNSDNGNELDNENLLDTQPVIIRRKRGRRPNSVVSPEEGHEHARRRSGKYSDDMSSDGYNEDKKDSGLFSKPKNGKHSSQKKIYYVGETSKKGRSNRNDGAINENDDVEFSFKVKSKIMKNKAKKKGYNVQKTTGEKERGVEKIKEFPTSNPAKSKSMTKDKGKKPKRPRVQYGEELVGSRIQVWWPMDETFYTGTIKEFDSVLKKHKILYDDDEVENLNLSKEKWELFDYERRPRMQEPVQFRDPSPAKEPAKTREKTVKKKSGLLKKSLPASSSKRSKGEIHVTKSGDSSALASTHSEIREKNDFQKDNGEKEKSMETPENGSHIPEDAMEG